MDIVKNSILLGYIFRWLNKMKLKGSYCLCININEKIHLTVGALGEITFSPGCYIYIGSALNGLGHRITRHINMSNGSYNAIHWHIDYLLKSPEVEITSIYFKESEVREECEIANYVNKRGDPIQDFGSSDCGCISHLYRVDECDFLLSLGLRKIVLEDKIDFPWR